MSKMDEKETNSMPELSRQSPYAQSNFYELKEKLKLEIELLKIKLEMMKIESQQKCIEIRSSNSNDLINPNVSNQFTDNQLKGIFSNMELPKKELNKFKGDPLTYCSFMKNFETVICKFTDSASSRLNYLIQYCEGDAKRLIEHCNILDPEDGYNEAMRLLKSRFGQNHVIANTFIRKLTDGPTLKANPESIRELAYEMKVCYLTLNQMNYISDLNCSKTIESIMLRLPLHFQRGWSEVAAKVFKSGREPEFKDLLEFVEEKSDTVNNRYGLLLERNKTKSSNDVKANKICFYNSVNDKLKSVKCPLCSYQHYIDVCPIFTSQSIDERYKLVKERKLCIVCLKPNHVAKDCRSWRRCTIQGCNLRHHTLLHSIYTNDAVQPPAVSSSLLCSAISTFVNDESKALSIVPDKVENNNNETQVCVCSVNVSDSTFVTNDVSEELSISQVKPPILHHTISRNDLSQSPQVSDSNFLYLDKKLPSINDDYVDTLIGYEPEAHIVLDQDVVNNKSVLTLKTPLNVKCSKANKSNVSLSMKNNKEKFDNLCDVELQVNQSNKEAVLYQMFVLSDDFNFTVWTSIIMLLRRNMLFVFIAIIVDLTRLILEKWYRWLHSLCILKEIKYKQCFCVDGLYATNDILFYCVTVIFYDAVVYLRAVSSEAHIVLNRKHGRDGDPYAFKTLLGWTLFGPLNNSQFSVVNNYFITSCLTITDIDEKVDTMDFQNYQSNDKTMSVNDKLALTQMKRTLQFVNGHYQMGLPWRFNTILPDNRVMAEQRLRYLMKRFLNDPELHHRYTQVMKKYLNDGHAEPVRNVSTNDSWYLPHHPVFHPKKPEKLRIVFDCAAKYAEVSLNDNLLSGPDLTSSLLGVLIRFRRYPIALTADIEAMFHQVFVTPSDRNFLKFLWWPGGELTRDPKVYRMQVHLFGATSSPSCATLALKQTIQDNKEKSDDLKSDVE